MPKPSADCDTAKLQSRHASQVMRTFTRNEEDRDVSNDVGAAMQHVGADHPRVYLKQVLAGIIAAGVQSKVSRCARCERLADLPVLALTLWDQRLFSLAQGTTRVQQRQIIEPIHVQSHPAGIGAAIQILRDQAR